MPDAPTSPLDAALARVGDRWSLLVVEALLGGPRRYNELLAAIPGLASNVLSQRLKRLEQEAVIVARPYSERPPRFTYELTEAGAELAGALRLLSRWGGAGGGPRHAACGAALEARWHCPTCARIVDDPEGEDLDYA
ncbi:MAG TPA: helix-turn-helix domain-containing protein [Acidimicrobiia bacterium]|nr:helix-turn-helix domain-containing protein [Acidimicrobiia bacterium]